MSYIFARNPPFSANGRERISTLKEQKICSFLNDPVLWFKTKTWLKFPDLHNNLYALLYHQLKDSLRENHLNCSFNALGKSFTLGIASRSATSSFSCLLAKGHAVWVAFIIHRNHKFISTATKRRQINWSWFQWSWNWCGYSAECWLRYWFVLFHEADYLAGSTKEAPPTAVHSSV